MAEPKTHVNAPSMDGLLERTTKGERRDDYLAMMKIMKKATRSEPRSRPPDLGAPSPRSLTTISACVRIASSARCSEPTNPMSGPANER